METEYASNAKANTGVALGSVALGLQALTGWGNGGILGCNSAARTAGALAEGQLCAGLMAQVGQLTAEKYADKNTADVYAALKIDSNRLADKIGEIEKWQAAEIAAAPLREQLISQRLGYCEAVLSKITQIGVPNGVLVPGVPPVQVVHPTTTTPVVA